MMRLILTTRPQTTGATTGAMMTETANADILDPRTSRTNTSAIVVGGTVWLKADVSPANTRAMQKHTYVGDRAIQMTHGMNSAEPRI